MFLNCVDLTFLIFFFSVNAIENKTEFYALTDGLVYQGTFIHFFNVVNGKHSAKVQNFLCEKSSVGRSGHHHQV